METLKTRPNRTRLDRFQSFQLSDIDWTRPIDRSRPWSPQAIAPMTYLPSYAKLTAGQKLRYNQLFSLGVAEQFIWFERDLLCPVLEKVRSSWKISSELKSALGQFIEDEDKHSEMFWRLLEKSEPQFYPRRRYYFLNLSSWQRAVLAAMVARPRLFLVWVWAAIFFEERTLDYSRHYLLAQREDPEGIDALYSRCHRLHLVDESRHHEIDVHLLRECYDPAPRSQRRMAGIMMARLMRSFVAPRRISMRVIEKLSQEFGPDAESTLSALWRELPLLGQSREFHEIAFGRSAVGKTLDLFAVYPEMNEVLGLFHTERARV